VQRAVSDIAAAANDAEAEIRALLDADLKWLASASNHVLVRGGAELCAHTLSENVQVLAAASSESSLDERDSAKAPLLAVQCVAHSGDIAVSSTRPMLLTRSLAACPQNISEAAKTNGSLSQAGSAPQIPPVPMFVPPTPDARGSAPAPSPTAPRNRFPVNEQGEVRLSQPIPSDINASAAKPLFRAKPTKGEGIRMAPVQSAQRTRNLIAKTPGVRAPLNPLSQPAWSFETSNRSQGFAGVLPGFSSLKPQDGLPSNISAGVNLSGIRTAEREANKNENSPALSEPRESAKSHHAPSSSGSRQRTLSQNEQTSGADSSSGTERGDGPPNTQATAQKTSRPRIAVNKSALRSKIERVRDEAETKPDDVVARVSQATPNSITNDLLISDPGADLEVKAEAVDPHPPRDENLSSLMNLMTSVKSFLPSLRPKKVGEQSTSGHAPSEGPHGNVAVSDKATAAALKAKDDLRIQKQKENEEKQRRAELKRNELAKVEKQREEDRRRKEAERARKLHDAVESKKRKQVEEERRREEKRRRVEENRRRLAEHAAPDTRTGFAARTGADASVLKPKNQVMQVQKQVSPPASYEMTATKDAAGHSSDSDDEDRPRTKKRLPPWARSSALSDVLANERRDPDTIFERVHTINLDEVFDGHKTKKFRPRTSSGVWVRDRLTAQEEVEYKKRAGIL
jgi:hypothetical protein